MFHNVGKESERDVITASDVDERRTDNAAQVKAFINFDCHWCSRIADLETLPAVQATRAVSPFTWDSFEARLREKAFCVWPNWHRKLLRICVQWIVDMIPESRVVFVRFCPSYHSPALNIIIMSRPEAYRRDQIR